MLILEIAGGIILAKLGISAFERVTERFDESPWLGWVLIGIAVALVSILGWK